MRAMSARRGTPRVILTVLLVLGLLAVACDGDGGGDSAGSEQRAEAQDLVVGWVGDEYTTEGDEADVGQYPLNANIFDGLVRMDANYQLVPVLATEWEFVPPNTWRFTLRRGVEFHDGQPFTAEAVKYTFDRIARTGGGTPGFSKRGTVVIDDYTIEVTPQFDNRRLVDQLVHPTNYIIAPGSSPAEEPIGTGPFRFVSYSRDEEFVVERNPDYWGTPPELDTITFRFLPEPNTRRLALEASEVDMIVDVAREAVADLEAKGFEISTSEVGAYAALYLNISGEKGYTILQDANVRQAIGYAIDRNALVDAVLEGFAAKEQTMVPTRLLGEANASKVTGFTYDPARAEQLLEEAGWTEGPDGIRQKDGQPLRLEFINGFPSAEQQGAMPEFIQDQLGEVGIGVDIVRTPDTASYEERLVSGEGDIWIEQGSQNDANPLFLPALLFWSVGLFGDIGYQPLFAPGAEFDAIIEEALATPDPEEVKSLVGDAMQVLIDQEAVVIPLAGLFGITALSDAVQSFEPQPSRLQVRYDSVYMTE